MLEGAGNLNLTTFVSSEERTINIVTPDGGFFLAGVTDPNVPSVPLSQLAPITSFFEVDAELPVGFSVAPVPAPPHRRSPSKAEQRKADPTNSKDRTGDRGSRRQGRNGFRWLHD
jgi:hypothetical protein